VTGVYPTLEKTEVTENFLLFYIVLKKSVLFKDPLINKLCLHLPRFFVTSGLGMLGPTVNPSTRSADQTAALEVL